MRFAIAFALTLTVLGVAQEPSGEFPGFSSTAGVPEGRPPVADAGSSRYAAGDPVRLDGSGSYDPDSSGSLSYAWHQVSGPVVEISAADTAGPTISGFIQTDEIQEYEFELVVSDGELTSRPDTVKVVIVPDFGDSTLELQNPPFDEHRPSIIYFGDGDCISGGPGTEQEWAGVDFTEWHEKANIIFSLAYGPDPVPQEAWRTYYHQGDMVIVYLSEVAPDYSQSIQTIGWSTGGQPATDVGIRLNRLYQDARYNVNRVAMLDTACRWNENVDILAAAVELYLSSPVASEPCWLDGYSWWALDTTPDTITPDNIPLFVNVGIGHSAVRDWYWNSLATSGATQFNSGIVGGAYWSVVGPGRNLQPARHVRYYYRWYGDVRNGSMGFFDKSRYPGRLPEPVALVGPGDGAIVDAGGALLSCEESENAVGYRLFLGGDPCYMIYLLSDTPEPPDTVLTTFPFPRTWWTVQAYDQYGSAVHADPICIHAARVEPQKVENLTMGRVYASIQQAIDDARPGDEIVIDAGVYDYRENLDLKGKNLTLRSADPNDPAVVAATVISAHPARAAITMSGSRYGDTVLAGLTIKGGATGIVCRDASPTIKACTIESGGPDAIEFWCDCQPDIVNCAIVGAVTEIDDPRLITHWRLDESVGNSVSDSVGGDYGILVGIPAWQPAGGKVGGALAFDGTAFVATYTVLHPSEGPFSVFAWIQGGAPGQVIISQQDDANWLMVDPADGRLMTGLGAVARSAQNLDSEAVITDGHWHRVGFTWDGGHRRLYVDDILVAEDTQVGLKDSDGSVLIGCGKDQAPGTFWFGLIDDVRIYNRAVKP